MFIPPHLVWNYKFPNVFWLQERQQIELQVWRLGKAGVVLASFLLLPPQLGNIKLDLKGAAYWAHGLVIRSFRMVEVRNILPKCLRGQEGDTDWVFSPTGFWRREGVRG